MAKIEWIDTRLSNWARWSAERAAHGMGYPRTSAFARSASAPRHAESRNSIPVNGIDAELTECAVQALRSVNGSLHAVIVLHYLHDISGTALAQRMGGISTSRVYQKIEDAHHVLEQWFATHRAEQKHRAMNLSIPRWQDDGVD